MASSTFTLTPFLLLSFLLFSSPAAAFNITKLLANYPDLSSFSSALTQTQVADQINSRQTITVLAVDNAALSSVSGKPADELKNVLSLHVVLDYYDTDKLKNLPKKTGLLTTLFQSTGQATGQTGFLNATVTSSGVELGSAVPGAGLTAQIVKSVVAQPYNISVLQISSVIVPPGIESSSGSKNGSVPASSPKLAPTPAAAPKQAPSPKKATSPAAASPSDDAATPSPSMAKPPAAAKAPSSDEPPAAAKAPSSDEPPAAAMAPSSDEPPAAAKAPPSDAPSSDAPSTAADAPADGPSAAAADAPGPSGDSTSAGSRVSFGTSLVVLAGIAAWVTA